VFHAIAAGFNYLWDFLKQLGWWLLDGIAYLLRPVFEFFGSIFYFVYKIGVVLVKIVEIVLAMGRLLIGLCTGLFRTITGLGYSGRPAAIPDSYQEVFDRIQPIFITLQLDKVAYLVQFAIWIMTAFAAIRIIGAMRGGASDD